jgi:MFS family permease
MDMRWAALALAALSVAGNYYCYDAIAPVADALRVQRGLTQSQIGLLNGVFSLPNIPLALVGGIVIDRFGAANIATGSALLCFVGAALTAIGDPFALMVTGRLVFGVGEETLYIALLALLAQWFAGGPAALAMSLFFSTARVGSYMADISPNWAAKIYATGWQRPLVLAAALAGASLLAAVALRSLDARRALPRPAAQRRPLRWSDIAAFDRSFWLILTLNVLFASVFFPFRSTFAIVFFQDAKGLTLGEAGLVNSWVFFAAIFATPAFGALADRAGHRALLLLAGATLMPATFVILSATDWSLWISTALMGVSFSVIPAVIWPATAMLVERERLGTAFGIINVLQNLGLFASNYAAGALNDRFGAGPANPGGYDPMLTLFACLSFVALATTVLLWVRERSPEGHGLEAPLARLAPVMH